MPSTVVLRSSHAHESCPWAVARVAPQGPVPPGGGGHGIDHTGWVWAPEAPSLSVLVSCKVSNYTNL